MAGYLDQYGAGEERRLRIIKIVVISLVSVVVLGGVGLFVFHNFRQERQVKRFFARLQAHDYQGAYEMWVETESDRRGYPFTSFLQDWGPQGAHADVSAARIARSRSCGNGVILTIDFGNNQRERLWVQRENLALSYSPTCAAGCPSALPPCFPQAP